MQYESIWVALIIDAAVKSAVLLAAGWLGALFIMRRMSAARRHLLWAAMLCACLLMPLLSLALPQWRVLPNWSAQQPQIPVASTPTQFRLTPPAPADGAWQNAPALPAIENAAPAIAAPQLPAHPAWWRGLSWQQWAMLAWGIGVAACLLPLLIGRLAIARVCHRKRPYYGYESSIAILLSPRCHMPMAYGILRRRVVLPDEAEFWPEERVRAVLEHELAHIRRRDCLWQLLGQLARAMYWCNPLLWITYRQLLCESERACDDAVLARGAQASNYAEHLMAIATAGRSDALLAAAAIAMARPTTLEGRLLAILDSARSRKRVSFITGVIVLLVLAGLAVPLAMLRAANGQNVQPKAESWQALVEIAMPVGPAFISKNGLVFTFAEPYEKNGATVITVSHEALDAEHRIVAVGKNGELHPGRLSGGGQGGKIRQDTAVFDGVTLQQIRSFQIQLLKRNLTSSQTRRYTNVVLLVNNHRFGATNGMTIDVGLSGEGECGHPGAVSKVSYRFVGSSDQGDTYELTRVFPSDGATPSSASATVTYKGEAITVWEDSVQRIVLKPKAQPTTTQADPDGRLDSSVAGQPVATDPVAPPVPTAPRATTTQAATRPASTTGRLDFRIAVATTGISPERRRDMLQQLLQHGPDVPADAASDLIWVEAAVSEPSLLIVDHQGKHYVLLSNDPKHTMLYDGTWGLTKVFATTNDMAIPAVGFRFDDAGAAKFKELTSTHLKQMVACALDGKVISTATIQSVISRSGIISAEKMTKEEAARIIEALNARIAAGIAASIPADAIALKLVPAQSGGEYPVFAMRPGASPVFTWTLPAEPKIDYLGLFVIGVLTSHLDAYPQQNLWRAMNDIRLGQWCVLGFPGDGRTIQYGTAPKADGPMTVTPARELQEGFYLVALNGYQGQYNPQEGRQPVVRGTCILKVGNPTDPPKPDFSKFTVDQMQAVLQGFVEDFFSANYRDITARKTLEWGKVQKLDNGNWQIRYKYEATIWNKDKVIQDKLFTFTPEGGFVEVKDTPPPFRNNQ